MVEPTVTLVTLLEVALVPIFIAWIFAPVVLPILIEPAVPPLAPVVIVTPFVAPPCRLKALVIEVLPSVTPVVLVVLAPRVKVPLMASTAGVAKEVFIRPVPLILKSAV